MIADHLMNCRQLWFAELRNTKTNSKSKNEMGRQAEENFKFHRPYK